MTSTTNPLVSLGDDVLLQVLWQLPTKQALALSQVSRDLHRFLLRSKESVFLNLDLRAPLPSTAAKWGPLVDCRPRRVVLRAGDDGRDLGVDLGYALEIMGTDRLEVVRVAGEGAAGVAMVGRRDLDRSLAGLGRLEVLDLAGLVLRTHIPTSLERPVVAMPVLRCLGAMAIVPEDPEGIAWHFQAPKLEVLSLPGNVAHCTPVATLSDLVESCRSSLREVNLGLPWFRLNDALLLQGCPGLRSLAMISHSTFDDSVYEHDREALPPALSRFTMRNFSGLERLSLEARGLHKGIADEADLTWAMRRNPISFVRLAGCSHVTGSFAMGTALRELELESITPGMTWGMVAGILAHCLSLERLALSDVLLEDDPPTFSLSSESLKRLALDASMTRTVPALGSLKALEELAVTDCPHLASLRPAAPPRLRRLDLSGSLTSVAHARSALPPFLAALRLHSPELAEVDLSRTAADDACLAALSGSSVSVLTADSCEHLERPALEDASHLLTVFLRSCPSLRSVQLAKARRLQALFLRDCPRLSDDFRQFEGMTRLKILDLSGCELVSNTLVSTLADAMLDLALVLVQGKTKVTRNFLTHDRFKETGTRFLARPTEREELERILTRHKLRWEKEWVVEA